MKAQLIRLRRFLGISGLIFLGFQAIVVVFIVTLGAGFAWIGVVMPIITFGGLFVAVKRASGEYQRTASVRGYQHTLFKLLDSQSEFCVILRPFGRDGMTIVRDLKGIVRGGIGPRKYFGRRANTTMEQVVGRAARQARLLLTYAIVDSSVRVAPPGPVFMSAPHDQWQMVAAHLIARAHTIVLMVPEKSRTETEGFLWELEQISEFGLQSRAVVVLPPPVGRRKRPNRAAVAQARSIVATLSGATTVDYGLGEPISEAFPDNAIVIRTSFHTRQTKWWFPQPPERVPGKRYPRRWYVSSGTYEAAVVEAIKEIEAEMSDWSFGARYSV